MPLRPKQPCGEPGCTVLTEGKRCSTHRRESARRYEATRPSASKRLYGREWQRESKLFLRQHPLCMCQDCDEGRKRVLSATVVDHKRPHRGDPELFWDRGNWQSMNEACHNRKTATEDGGFGRGGAGQIPADFAP